MSAEPSCFSRPESDLKQQQHMSRSERHTPMESDFGK